MNHETHLRLNRTIVRQLISAQGLKHWWVAEITGVHKTTLRRWLSGTIDRVAFERIEKLAQTLGETPAHIVERGH
jgi:DNA-binding Xre family transcriptional regulator